MFLVAGLGNPGLEYEGNRHNVGFMVVDALQGALALPAFKRKFSGAWSSGSFGPHPLALLKPLTYMNVSGDSVQPAAAFLKVGASDIIVVHDELDLPWKDVRVKVGGGHAGHNGLRSIIQRLGTADFVRVRIGIGKPGPAFRGDGADWVLSDFSGAERAELPGITQTAMQAVKDVVEHGAAAAMNTINARRRDGLSGSGAGGP